MEPRRPTAFDTVAIAERAVAQYPGTGNPNAPAHATADAMLATTDYDELRRFTDEMMYARVHANLDRWRPDGFGGEVIERFRQTQWTPTEGAPSYNLLAKNWGVSPSDVPAGTSEVLRVSDQRRQRSDTEIDHEILGHWSKLRGGAEAEDQSAYPPEITPLEHPQFIDVTRLANAVDARRRHHARMVFNSWLGFGAVLGAAGAGAFIAANSQPITTNSTVNQKVDVAVPYKHTQTVNQTAGALNATANNYVVPSSTITVDAAAFKSVLAEIQGQHLKAVRVSVAIHGESSQAPANGGNFYALPPSGPSLKAEQADQVAEDRVALQRAEAAKTGLGQADAGYDVEVTQVDGTMVPPTEAQRSAIEAAAEHDHATVAAWVAAFEQDPNSVPEQARELLKQILSDNQGFKATITVQGTQETTREVPVTKSRTEQTIDKLTLAKATIFGGLTVLGGIVGAFVGSLRQRGGIQRRARRGAAKYRKA